MASQRCIIIIIVLMLASVVTAKQYYGKYFGDLAPNKHKISGKVYGANGSTFHIEKFVVPGGGSVLYPVALHFWVGEKDKAGASPDAKGTVIPGPFGRKGPVGVFNGDTALRLPKNLKITDLRWLSLWDKAKNVDYASVQIPANYKVPKPRNIGEFSRLAHGLKSGDVIVQDGQTIKINDFHYDGLGPAANYYLGKTDKVYLSDTTLKIPDQDGLYRIVRKQNGDTFSLTLPSDVSVYDFKWLSLYCKKFNHNFGIVKFPSDLYVPSKITVKEQLTSGQLGDSFSVTIIILCVSWSIMCMKSLQ